MVPSPPCSTSLVSMLPLCRIEYASPDAAVLLAVLLLYLMSDHLQPCPVVSSSHHSRFAKCGGQPAPLCLQAPPGACKANRNIAELLPCCLHPKEQEVHWATIPRPKLLLQVYK